MRVFPMLVIRLQRTGRKNHPAYRVVVAEKSAAAKGKSHEIVGHYLPTRTPVVFECNQDRALYWIGKGAQPSDTLARLLKKAGMKNLEKFTRRYSKRKSKSDQPEEPAAPAAASAEPEKPAEAAA